MNHNDAVTAIRTNPELADRAREEMQAVLARSATDSEFRRLLLSDSRAALGQHFGREIPESVNIAFVENKADTTLVLPDAVDPSAELSETELEAVAGGSLGVFEIAALAVAACMIIDKMAD